MIQVLKKQEKRKGKKTLTRTREADNGDNEDLSEWMTIAFVRFLRLVFEIKF